MVCFSGSSSTLPLLLLLRERLLLGFVWAGRSALRLRLPLLLRLRERLLLLPRYVDLPKRVEAITTRLAPVSVASRSLLRAGGL